jgi:hypothetical protein
MTKYRMEGIEMFVHFDSSKGARCDDCGALTTIIHVSLRRYSRSFHLCNKCFRAMTLALCQGSKRLKP